MVSTVLSSPSRLRRQQRLLPATRCATALLAPSALSSRYLVFGRFHCLSWIALRRWRSHSSSLRQTLGVCANLKYAFRCARVLIGIGRVAGFVAGKFTPGFTVRYPCPPRFLRHLTHGL